jgi:hypothetical protein
MNERASAGRRSPACRDRNGGALSLCFTCVYLMPSLTCEERERGLLWHALSPATAFEILAAKFLFYPAFGILLATLLAGIHNSAVLGRPFFWMTLVAAIAPRHWDDDRVLTNAPRVSALCYMLAVAADSLVCQRTTSPPAAPGD